MSDPTQETVSASSASLTDETHDMSDTEPEEDLQFNLPLQITIEESSDQLSAPKTNKPFQLSEPRLIISESASKINLVQAKLLRPILAGTYFGDPAYLLRLQLHLYTPGASRSWLSRIQSASINVTLQDAPVSRDDNGDSSEEEDSDEDEEPEHPSIVNTFPSESGWEGPLRSALLTRTIELGTQIGYQPFITASVGTSFSETREKTGAVKIKVGIRGESNILNVVLEENPIDREGVPDFLVVPFVVAHNARRFSVRVVVNARYGFMKGILSEMWPILGRNDDPVYFDPTVMKGLMEKGKRDKSGQKKVEWLGELDHVNLQDYSSLIESRK
ncbi:hypothetical protein VTL71DRAFT_4546 [Oculimacula yallundae]|uniref:Uncharacterized protein n=1 Tax=Oculimacula yallundae TaxID=86028 RepID=A0ABR4C3F3_9HELO